MSKMNLPNKLTIFRVILIVPFIILLLGGQAGWFGENTFVTDMIALAIFIIASLTDLIDGKIARKYNLITDFGKFMDPLADKLLVCSAMIALIEMNRIPSWVVIILSLIHIFVNLVMNAEMQLAEIYAGHYLTSWQRACEAVDRIYRVDVPERADMIVASCGGFPKDMSLYQGTKTIDNIEFGLKRGGTLVLLIEARDGGGPEEYFDWIRDWTNGTMEARLREHFTVPGYIFLLNCEQAKRYNILMLTSVPAETVAPMGLKAFSDVESLMKCAQPEGKKIYVIPNGSTVVPHVKGEE